MNRSVTTFEGDSFFRDGLLIYVNRAAETFAVPFHNHDFLEITYVAEGSGFHHIGNDVLKVRKGDLFVIPIGVTHVFRPSADNAVKHPLAVYNCVVSTRLLERLAPVITDSRISDFVASLTSGEPQGFALADQGDTLEKLFQALYREFVFPREGSADYLQTLLLQLLITIRRMREHRTQDAAASLRSLSFIDVLQYVDERIHQDITLVDLARFCGYSERHLQRLFQLHTGQTFSRYRQNRRVEKSCELLRSTPLKISAVAEQVGYKDMDTFIGVFKRSMGITPSEYRRASSAK